MHLLYEIRHAPGLTSNLRFIVDEWRPQLLHFPAPARWKPLGRYQNILWTKMDSQLILCDNSIEIFTFMSRFNYGLRR